MPAKVLIDPYDGVNASAKKQNPFQRLVKDLSDVLGPSSGLDSKEVNHQTIIDLMEAYKSNEQDWDEFAFEDTSMTFTRNLVDEGNEKSNLLLLVWTPNKETPVHDHADSHCVMKMLRGSLTETKFEFPKKLDSGDVSPKALRMTQVNICKEGEVTYICDNIGLHKITSGEGSGKPAVSLHLYTPPNAAKDGFTTFDEETGAETFHQEYNYYSKKGQKL